ncbi:MAG: hypothetical protein AAFV80_24195 [Bacteroidota bacterium]
MKLPLYYSATEGLTIDILVYFNSDDQLILDACDSGTIVEELRGDWDYEYSCIVEPSEVPLLAIALDVPTDDRMAILKALQQQFSVRDAYTIFGQFLEAHNIPFKRFTWI